MEYGQLEKEFHNALNRNLDEADSLMERALTYANRLNNDVLRAKTYNNLGEIYYNRGQLEDALIYFNNAVQLSKTVNKNDIVANVDFDLGLFYSDLGLQETALAALRASEKEFLIEPYMRNRLLVSLEIANVLAELKRNTEALKRLRDIMDQIPEPETQADDQWLYFYLIIVESYIEMKDFASAEQYLKRIEKPALSTDKNFYKGLYAFLQSKISSKTDRLDEAKAWGEESLARFEEHGDVFEQARIQLQLAFVSRKQGREAEAMNYLFSVKGINDRLLSQREAVFRINLDSREETIEQYQNRVNEFETARRIRQIIGPIIVLLLVSLSVLAFVLYRSLKSNRVLSTNLEAQAAQLSRFNDDKNHFIGVVSHDLRSPLNSITALSELMLSSIDELSLNEVKEYVEIIDQSANRMTQMVNNMLDVNRIEQGLRTITLESISVNEIVQKCYTGLKKYGSEKLIATSLELDEDPLEAIADSNALYRVVENLLSNAYKFSEKNTRVTLSTSHTKSEVLISIKDEGPGISTIEMDRLFTKFAKLSASPTGNEKSTGLGLYIVHSLVQEMNGTVNVNSVLGEGSTFIVTLPRGRA